MREIKFRAWNPKTKLMGDCATLEEIIEIVYTKPDDAKRVKVIWIQFIGSKDKAGVEICEGDILKVIDIDDEPRKNQVVEYSDKWGGWFIEDDFGEYDITTIGLATEFDGWTFEVIGNIYENGDLLK